MIGHLSQRRLRAFDHPRELVGRRRLAASRHLERCSSCRRRLATISAIRAAVAEPTADAPSDSWRRIRSRIERGDAVLLPTVNPPNEDRGEARRPRSSRLAVVAAAAGTLIVAGAGLAASAGALGHWMEALWAGREPEAASSTTAGIEVPAPASGLVVELREADPDLRLRFRPAEAEGELVALAVDAESSRMRFSLEADRVAVFAPGGGELEIRAPPGVIVRVEAEGQLLLRIVAGQVAPPDTALPGRFEARLGDLLELQRTADEEADGADPP